MTGLRACIWGSEGQRVEAGQQALLSADSFWSWLLSHASQWKERSQLPLLIDVWVVGLRCPGGHRFMVGIVA